MTEFGVGVFLKSSRHRAPAVGAQKRPAAGACCREAWLGGAHGCSHWLPVPLLPPSHCLLASCPSFPPVQACGGSFLGRRPRAAEKTKQRNPRFRNQTHLDLTPDIIFYQCDLEWVLSASLCLICTVGNLPHGCEIWLLIIAFSRSFHLLNTTVPPRFSLSLLGPSLHIRPIPG